MTFELGSGLVKGAIIKTLFQEEFVKCAKMEQKGKEAQRARGLGLSWNVLLNVGFSLYRTQNHHCLKKKYEK